ncbi:MAG TPA: DUF1549 domain-containing protein, partial [Gemmataceae bacterium]|nr:DUF1549 domain-containing protein [Gemmataceae bacterium]
MTLSSRTVWGLTAVLAAVAVVIPANPAAGQGDGKTILFEKDIAPIFQQHCIKCHGTKPKKAGLDLRTAAAAFAGGESGPVLVKGSAAKSVLFEKIESRTMPPPEKKDRLSDQEIALIRKWIDSGAPSAGAAKPVASSKERVVTEKDREYWAFRKPVAAPVPAVKATERVRTPVDAFLLTKLEASGLTFSPDAAKEMLVRRAYLDLIGLPPSPEEVRSFLADTRPDAYERLIDRLLDSPHYGERWGRHWLDVAGYTDAPHCDTVGNLLPIDDWRYRDYVIRSLNDDKPYDR